MQHTGETRHTRITQEQLKSQLDSLNKLVKGENISAAAKNYFIPPHQIVKISNLTNAKIFGPYQPVPSAFDASSVPEIYKFYSLSEEKEIIAKLTEMSKYKYEKGDEKGKERLMTTTIRFIRFIRRRSERLTVDSWQLTGRK